MSSTNRGVERQETDAYFTPPELAKLLFENTAAYVGNSPEDFSIVEPGCGIGTFLDAFKECGVVDYLGIEIVPEYADIARVKGHDIVTGDYLTWLPPEGKPNLIIGNPPFRLLESFVRHSLSIIDPDTGVVAFIARLNFLGGGERYARFWTELPPRAIWVMPARAGFSSDGQTDSIEYALFIWGNNESHEPTTLAWLDNRSIQNKWRPGSNVPARGRL